MNCCDCGAWRGRCARGKLSKAASNDACEEFTDAIGKFEVRVLFPRLLVNQKSQKKVGGEVNG